jgi:membrane protein
MLFHLVTFILVFISFLIVYLAVPHQRPHFRMILVSAISAAILWQVAQQLFGYYVSHFVTLKRIYGTYALFLAIGFWIYYSAIVFIIGAEIGQLYKERHADLG